MDDNMRNPKPKKEAMDEVKLLLEVVKGTNEQYKSINVVNTVAGKSNAMLKSHKTDKHPLFGKGKDKKPEFWMALVRQVLVKGYLRKEIEQYGVLKLTSRGLEYIEQPVSFMMTEDHSYEMNDDDSIMSSGGVGGGAADENLMKMLKDLQKKVAKKHGVPPYAVFQETSLEDMALKYPINLDELSNVFGVGEGKAKKFGAEFVDLIARYVEENEIIRPDDLIVKSTGTNSVLKLFIIQNTDRKIPLEDIARSKGIELEELIEEMQRIVYSGTKLKMDYIVDEILDEDQQQEIFDYFMESDNDKIETAMKEFKGEYEEDELRLMRIKFISDVAN
jgi:ATP-dependent DNA helicase RecQ